MVLYPKKEVDESLASQELPKFVKKALPEKYPFKHMSDKKGEELWAKK